MIEEEGRFECVEVRCSELQGIVLWASVLPSLLSHLWP